MDDIEVTITQQSIEIDMTSGDSTASGTSVDTSTFSKNLSVADTNVQHALETIDQMSGSGSGNVVGPASAADGNVVKFNGTTGKLIKDSGLILSGSNTGDQDLSSLVPTSRKVASHALSGDVTISTDDLSDGANNHLVSTAQKTVIGNTSGTNTGDQTLASLGAQQDLTAISVGVKAAKNLYNTVVPLGYNTSITLTAANGALFDIGAMTGDITLLSVTGAKAGMTFIIRVLQDGSGNHALTLDSGKFLNSYGGAAINATASKYSLISCVCFADDVIDYTIMTQN